jgi:hypothetical protein
MSSKYTEDSVSRILAMLGVGVVNHVDFTPIDKKPGFEENVNSITKSAFVHFLDTAITDLYSPGYAYNEAFWYKLVHEYSCSLQVSEHEYWICLKNNNPVKRTLMNIHQVVENGRHLERLVLEQAKKIEEQSEMINQLSEKLYGVHNVVYQLLGGLFNQRTQTCSLKQHLKFMFPKNYQQEQQEQEEQEQEEQEQEEQEQEEQDDTSKWSIWPTTRQGDDCENRIAVLERMLGVDNEEQDTALLARKRGYTSCDESTIDSSMVYDEEEAEHDDLEKYERDEEESTWREEQRYNDMLEEAAVDYAADMSNMHDGWR